MSGDNAGTDKEYTISEESASVKADALASAEAEAGIIPITKYSFEPVPPEQRTEIRRTNGVNSSPLARRLAGEAGISQVEFDALMGTKGTGPGGRIHAETVFGFIGQRGKKEVVSIAATATASENTAPIIALTNREIFDGYNNIVEITFQTALDDNGAYNAHRLEGLIRSHELVQQLGDAIGKIGIAYSSVLPEDESIPYVQHTVTLATNAESKKADIAILQATLDAFEAMGFEAIRDRETRTKRIKVPAEIGAAQGGGIGVRSA